MKNKKYNLLPYETIVKAAAGRLFQVLCKLRKLI